MAPKKRRASTAALSTPADAADAPVPTKLDGSDRDGSDRDSSDRLVPVQTVSELYGLNGETDTDGLALAALNKRYKSICSEFRSRFGLRPFELQSEHFPQP